MRNDIWKIPGAASNPGSRSLSQPHNPISGQPAPASPIPTHTPQSFVHSHPEVTMRPMFPMFAASYLLLFLLFFTQNLYARTRLETLALKAVSENLAESAPAIAELRAMGPAGLKAL